MRGRVIPFKQAKEREELDKQNELRTGCSIQESGIYRVLHPEHHLPAEVTLIKDQMFPRCSKCFEPIHFELVRRAPAVSHPSGFSVRLYELPVLAEQEDKPLAG